MHLFKSVGAATDTILRNAQSLAAMITAGAVEADFTNYAPKVLGTGDVTIVYDTSGFKGTLSVPAAQVWNPAGGAVNNTAIVKSVLCYRQTSGAAYSAYYPIAHFDASGGAVGGSYTHTLGTIVDDA